DIVKIPRRVVEDAIESAPKRIVIYDREGRESLLLEGKNTYFGMGITGLHFRDLESGERRDATLGDIGLACRVGDALPNLDLIATPLVVKATPEIPHKVVKQREFEAMLSNTTKPLMLLVDYVPILRDVLEMATVVAGGADALRERPFVLPYFNSVSPLGYNTDTLDNLLLLAEWGIPVICSPAPMAGATGPVTLAGTVVTANAEALGGLVICQLKRPGAPFITGSEAAIMYMRTANIAFGAPEQGILMMAAIEMAHYYGLPVVGLGCATDSIGLDQQTALEQMMGAYSCALAGVHLVPFIGFLETGLTFSPEAAIMGDEIIGMLKRIMRGVPVDDDTLALDTIKSVGPGGNFLNTEHTLRHYKREQWQPTLLCRTTFSSWVEGGSKLMGERVKEKLAEIIRSHQVKPLPNDVKAQISNIIERRKQSLS
ncbi:MAG: trimethylamine methyltransferase family protein, partial [Dehalococcoidia bacterium]